MDQLERRLYLIRELLCENPGYGDFAVPQDPQAQKRLLRSLFNVRMPGLKDPAFLRIQDDYLTQLAEEKGIVRLCDIPVVRDCMSIWQGDITRLETDAVVNAANSQMLGCFVPMHGCIDNCIHTYAGIRLREECSRKMEELRAKYGPDYEQPTAVPLLTDAYNLPAKKVIHVVGPIAGGHLTPELEDDLARCYGNTLDLCLENGLRSVAFCCISTGVFGFPNDRAARIAVSTVEAWLKAHDGAMERVVFNVFKDEDRRLYEEQFR
ncbi:MAG: protein-ADP-ribose hydrolase [Spirochaetales bacterium]|nr:protein-ADP-ribose hydrolase [Spirochaetales bacterium]